MQFRDDIMRGVRLAAIAFTVLLVGLIGYRMLHGTPTSAPPREIARPVAPVNPKPPDPLAVPAPPPPVPAHKSPVRRTTIKNVISLPQSAPIVRNADPEMIPPAPAEIPIHTVAAKELFVPELVPEPIGEPSAIPDQTAEKPPTRGKRALRAIGRLLHTGK